MPDEASLRESARAAIRSGKIPSRPPDRTWGGLGVEIECATCGLYVMKDQMAIEIQFSHNGATPELHKFELHVRCFAAWEFERGNLGWGNPRQERR
jgi:hypothetical protein